MFAKLRHLGDKIVDGDARFGRQVDERLDGDIRSDAANHSTRAAGLTFLALVGILLLGGVRASEARAAQQNSAPVVPAYASGLDTGIAMSEVDASRSTITLPSAAADPESVFLTADLSLISLGTDEATGARFWAVSFDNDPCTSTYKSSFIVSAMVKYTLVTIADPSVLLTTQEGERLITRAGMAHAERCPVELIERWHVDITSDEYVEVTALMPDPILGLGFVQSDRTGLFEIVAFRNYELVRHQRHLEISKSIKEDALERYELAELAAQQHARIVAYNEQAELVRREFVTRNNVDELIVDQGALYANPFLFSGKIVSFPATFTNMRTTAEGMFVMGGMQQVIVRSVPTERFPTRQLGVLAGRVMGNTSETASMLVGEPLPLLEFIDFYSCKEARCEDFFGR